MRKHFLIILIAIVTSITAQGQSKGVKIGYIDMEYILQNVPDYTEAKNQLEQKAQKWKQEIDLNRNEVNRLKESLKTEQALLTKELIEERLEEIRYQESQILLYQEKRFGPSGDLITQKSLIVKPIQDQIFTAIQDIAEAKKYDFIFDKSSDLTILFSAKKFDISEQVIRVIVRSEKREQMTKKQADIAAEKEAKEDEATKAAENPALAERKKIIEENRLAREKAALEKKEANELRRKEAEEKRKKLLEEKAAKRNGTVPADTKTEEKKP
ncbi:MAG: OmpH family outer membrane protein [Bacteroidota bacterium]